MMWTIVTDSAPFQLMRFPISSTGKESTCNAGDPGWIPGLGRSTGEGIGYPLQYSWAFLVAQLVKNLPTMWETSVWSLCWENPLKREWLPTPVFWPGELCKSWTWLSLSFTFPSFLLLKMTEATCMQLNCVLGIVCLWPQPAGTESTHRGCRWEIRDDLGVRRIFRLQRALAGP